jgi:hypothetical protein
MKGQAPYVRQQISRRSGRSVVFAVIAFLIALSGPTPAPAQMQGTPLDPPDLICPVTPYSDALILEIRGGGWGGAPAGFVLEWQTTADWQQYGWSASSPSRCSATFTGTQYQLDEDEVIYIQIGKNPFTGDGVVSECSNNLPLECGTEYRFRAKALATSNMAESPWSSTLGCSTDFDCANTAPAQPGLTPFDPPDLICPTTPYANALQLQVCGGGWGGAPAGFIIQWQTTDDWQTHGWPADGSTSSSPTFCEATFTGDQYLLDEYECIAIQFGANPWGEGVTSNCSNAAPLECGKEYRFRAKALGNDMMSESWWSSTLGCSTDYDCTNTAPGTGGEEPEEGCTFTLGYWKNHPEAWPVDELKLGEVTYSKEQLLQILAQPVRGNGLVALARQLIPAKLNVANGASDADVSASIMAADTMIGNLVVPPIGTGSLRTSQTSGLVDTLSAYNEGDIGPGHCDDSDAAGGGGKGKGKGGKRQ